MQLDRCKSCGGDLKRVGNHYVCNFCGSKWIIDADQDIHVIDRANAWSALRDCDFERACELFENIIFKEPDSHEAYWGRALASAGIMYVTDFDENKKVPTCNSISESSFVESRDVKKAIELAPNDIAKSYRAQAEQIEAIRVEWVKKASREPAYDVFISYKDSDREHGIERTDDSYDAHELYSVLTSQGYKVFFSRVSLRNKISEHYEPYIYNALKTAKVMIVFGEKPEYFNAVWIKNEWMRFRKRIELGEKHTNSLVVAYKGFDPADLPVGLRSRQCLDASGFTFLEDLKKHIAKVVNDKPEKKTVEQPKVLNEQKIDEKPTSDGKTGEVVDNTKKPKSKKWLVVATVALILAVVIGIAYLVPGLEYVAPDLDYTNPDQSIIIKPFDPNTSIGETNRPTDSEPMDTLTNGSPDDKYETEAESNEDTSTIPSTPSEDIIYQKSPDGSYAMVVGYAGSDSIIVISPDYDGVPVTAIQNNAFENCSDLINVIIPDSVTAMGDYAFSNCYNLTSITIPKSVTEIGAYCFQGCSALETVNYAGSQWDWGTMNVNLDGGGNQDLLNAEIIFAETVTTPATPTGGISYIKSPNGAYAEVIDYIGTEVNVIIAEEYDGVPVTSIAESAFAGKNIGSVWIPDSITTIKNRAFADCTMLKNVHIGDGVISIGESAFSNCHELRNIRLGNNVEVIDNNAFQSCPNLADINIPDSVISIGSWAFEGCSQLVEIIDGVSYVDDCVVRFDNSLASVTLKDGVRVICAEAFGGCTKLRTIIIPDSVTRICMNAFNGCSNLANVTMSSNLISIGNAAFTDCNNLSYNEYDNGYYLGSDNNPYLIFVKAKNTDITSCEINEATKFIHSWAFQSCNSLVRVTIPDGVTYIGNAAFAHCNSLTSVTIPDGLTSIADETFYCCDALTDITLPDNITSIGENAFANCYSLKTVKLPSSVTVIGNSAFAGDSNLTTVYYSGSQEDWDKVSIGDGNEYLTDVNINYDYNGEDSNVSDTESGSDASDETETTDFVYEKSPDGSYAIIIDYAGSDSIIVIPSEYNGVPITAIKDNAFEDCTNLVSVTIPDGVTTIGTYAFFRCSNLTSITIPKSLTEIGHHCFNSCNALETVNYAGSQWDWGMLDLGVSDESNQKLIKANIIFAETETTPAAPTEGISYMKSPDGTYAEVVDYTGTEVNIVIAEEYDGVPVTSIAEYAFSGKTISSIWIPDSVTAIKGRAFADCTMLKNVHIGDGVISIGDSAFYNCYELRNIRLGNNVEIIDTNAFQSCHNLANINIPDSVISIGPWAFENCGRLVEIIDGVSYVDDCVVRFDNSLASVTLKDGVRLISDDAFSGCTKLRTIIIPDSVTIIGMNAFASCSNLVNVTMSSNIITIGNGAFADCNKLSYNEYDNGYYLGNDNNLYIVFIKAKDTDITSCEINDATKVIHSLAFYGCNNLVSVTIPDGVTCIPNETFSSCTSLNEVILPNSVTSIGQYAFAYCHNLETITLPDGITTIGEWAFEGANNLTTVYYRGSQEDWDKVSIGDGNEYLTNANFNYNYDENVPPVEPGEEPSEEPTQAPETPETEPDTESETENDYGLEYTLNSDGNSYSVTDIGSCTEQDIVIPKKYMGLPVTSIGSYAFDDCYSLTSVTIGNSVTSIGDNAFEDCINLTSIDIPDSVTIIGTYAFYYCTSLTNIDIPDSIMSIGSDAFYYCTSLTSVMFENAQGWWCSLSSSATSGTDISSSDLAYASTAAEYLTSTYRSYYWHRD